MTKLTYLWAIALVALCLSMGSSIALAADSWEVTPGVAPQLPATLVWDQVGEATIDVTNNGTTTWNSTFGLESVMGITTAATPIDTWGLTLVPIVGVSVAPTQSFVFEFTITGPPITSLEYDQPVGPTEPGSNSAFDCNWILANELTPTSTAGTLIPTDTVTAPIVMSRFSDDQPTGNPVQDQVIGSWARFWIEELAGNVPFVVQGYSDGTYRPLVQVTRDQMAVFMARALKLTVPPFENKFTDIPEDFWARPQIEALVDSGIVVGYAEPDGTSTYRPALVVGRDQMAVFVARGIAGGDANVPSGPAVATFPDVGTDYWAFAYIEFAVAHGVVQGYPDGTYQPLVAVDRAQMSVFIWRGFVMPSGSVVVLAGPAITAVDVDTADFLGFTSESSGLQADPGFAYVGLDGVRLDTSLIFPQTPTGTFDILFELLPVGSPTPAATKLFMLTAAQVAAARAAAFASEDPYVFFTWQIPAGLAKGDYTLVVSTADETGALFEIARQPSFTID